MKRWKVTVQITDKRTNDSEQKIYEIDAPDEKQAETDVVDSIVMNELTTGSYILNSVVLEM